MEEEHKFIPEETVEQHEETVVKVGVQLNSIEEEAKQLSADVDEEEKKMKDLEASLKGLLPDNMFSI